MAAACVAGAVELRNALSTRMGLQLPATIVFDHPSAAALARHLFDTIAGVAADGPAGSASVTTAVELMPASLLAAVQQQQQQRRLVGIAALSAVLPGGGSAQWLPIDAPIGGLVLGCAE